jgi:hypothetical protein
MYFIVYNLLCYNNNLIISFFYTSLILFIGEMYGLFEIDLLIIILYKLLNK